MTSNQWVFISVFIMKSRFASIRIFRHFDWGLFLIVFVLFLLGLLAIYSLELGRGPTNEFLNFEKQLIAGILGLALMFLLSCLDWRFFRTLAWPLYVLGFLLLLAVLFFGETRRATTGWFSLGGFSFQPAELAKVFLIIAGAAFFSKKGFVPTLGFLLLGLAILSFYLVPIFFQPDFGSVFVMIIIWGGMFLMVGLTRKHLLAILAGGIIAAGLAWCFLLKDYQRERVLVFLQPERDVMGRGYNVSQAVVAIGSGGLLGHGLGGGSQSQLRFLPEAQTDFIFAVLAEELGFVVVALLLVLEVFLFYRVIAIARRLTDNFALFFLSGVLLLLGAETIANIGMNLGLFPAIGLTLPFISYGGSSLVSKFVLIGLVQSIRMRSY